MDKTLLIFKNEFRTYVLRKSFIFVLLLGPAVGLILTLIIQSANHNASSGAPSPIAQFFTPEINKSLEGYVDLSGRVTRIPENLSGRLKAFSSEELAAAALGRKEIVAYYLIPADVVDEGEIIYVRPDFNPISGQANSSVIIDLMIYNLLDGDQTLAYRVADPLNTTRAYLTEQPQRDPNSLLTFFLPYIVTMLLYALILTTSSVMLSSVNTEKSNRVIEILMTSVTPIQMLTGKIVALGLAGLLQTLVWTLSGWLLLRLGSGGISISFQLPFTIILWGLLFFLLGYALYGSLMAGVGALVPNMREASQVTTLIILPMVLPLIFINLLIEAPSGTAATIFSLFPFTAPIAMMTRLAATNVPVWQPILSAALLVATVILLVRSIAGMFRAQTLLSGQPFSARVFFRALFGKV